MIRLTLAGLDEAISREAVKRVRGALLAAVVDWPEPSAPFDAAAFVGLVRPRSAPIERLLHAGKHVLVASAVCWPHDALEILSLTPHDGSAQLAVVNPERWLPSRRLIRQQLDTGKLGEAVLVRSHRWSPRAQQASRLPPALGRDVDLALWLLGKAPNRVYAVGIDRFVQAHLGFPCGGMALIDHDDSLPAGAGYQSLAVIGTSGAAYADDQQNMQLLYPGDGARAVRTEEGIRQLALVLQDFVDAVSAGRPMPDNRTAWQSAASVLDAVQRSLQSRQAVTLEGL